MLPKFSLQKQRQSIPDHFPNIELGMYVIMPNHVHGVIIIHDQNHRTAVYPPSVGAQHAAPLLRPYSM